MAQLKDSLVQGSMRVTDTLYTTNLNLNSATASLSLFTDANKNLITKSAADARTALGVGASGTHADSFFVKAITSTDNSIVRFDSTAGQIQGGKMTLSDEGYLRSYNTTRWTIDWYIYHPGASKQVAELYFDSGDATNITTGTLYWRQYSPTSTASNTPTAYHETYNMPTVTKDLTANKTYAIITTKNLSAITSVGTLTNTVNLQPSGTSAEGGELHLCAAASATTKAGIVLDNYDSKFRIFGIQSADGTTKTGVGEALVIDPYAKTITGGYTITGTLSGNATNVTGTVAIEHGGTGETSAIAGITALGGPYIALAGTSIPENANLDSYITAGTYYSPSSSRSDTLSGVVPFTTSGFKMFVVKGYGGDRTTQWVQRNDNQIRLRYSNDGSTWEKWYQLVKIPSGSDNFTFSNIGSATTPVYVDKSGNVIAGTAIKALAYKDSLAASDIPTISIADKTTGTLTVSRGGTSATTAAAARTNLGTAPYIQGVFYGTCATEQATKAKQVILTNGEGFALNTGVVVFVKFTYASAAGTMTMAISDDNGSTYCTAKNLYRYATTTMSSGTTTTGWRAGAMVCFVYDGTGWERIFWENTTYSYMRPYESTANGTTAEKTGASGWKFQLTAGKYFMYSHYYDNTYEGALTLNIGNTGAKSIYINGAASSASNHTLPGGQYLVYYDGTNYYFRTDDKMTGNITGTASNVTGTVAATHGGTGITTYTLGDIIYCSGVAGTTPTLSKLAIGSKGKFLKVGAGNVPVWGDGSSVTLNGTTTTSASFYAPTGAGTSGQFLKSNGSGAPTWAAVTDEKVKVAANITTAADYPVVFANSNTSTTAAETAGLNKSGANFYFNPSTGLLTATQVANAIWNDYAEYRKQLNTITPGHVVKDTDSGYVIETDERLIPGAQIVSDTWGHSMGKTNECQTPVAVAGRVLAYTYRPREEYHAGMAVCSAPNGTIDIMTREEIRDYPDAIIGIVSEIPDYEEWGSGNVKVDGRIWIKVR